MRTVWKVLLGVLGLVVVVAGGGLVYVLNIDANAYKADIVEAVRERTGRELTIGGPIELDIGAETRLRVTNVAFANADWGSRPQMATVGEFEAVVRLIPTLFGEPDVTRIRLIGVDVLVETNEAGVANTAFAPPGHARGDGEERHEGPREVEAPEGGQITIPILRDVLIEDVTATLRNAQAGTENVFRLERLALAGEGPEAPLTLDMTAAFDELPLLLAGTLGAPAAMLDSGRPWDVDVAGNLAGVDVAATGAILDPTTGRGVDLALSALGEELADVAQKLGIDAPEVGRFEVRAELQGDTDGDLAAENVLVDVGSPAFIHLTVEGRVASAVKAAGLDLAVGVEGVEIGNLSPLADRFAGQTVPDLGPFKIGARVTGGLERGVAVTGLDAAMGDAGLILLSAKGGIADAVNASGLDLSVAARSNQIGALSAIAESYTGQGVPALGPLDFGARLVGDLPMAGRAGKLSVRELDFALGVDDLIRVTAQGEIADAMAQSGLAIDVTATSLEVGALDAVSRQFANGQGVPDLGPLDLRARVAGSMADGLAIQGLDLDFGRVETLKLTAQGSVQNALQGAGADLSFALVSPDLSVLSGVAGASVPAIGPVDVTGALTAGANEPVTLEPFTAKIGGSDLSGSVVADLGGAVPKITGRLSSQRFDTADVTGGGQPGGQPGAQAGGAAGGQSAGAGDAAPADDGRVIPGDPLPLDGLKAVDADLRYTAQTLVANGSVFDNLQLALALAGGRLSIDTLTADVGAGALDGTVVLDGSVAPAPLTIALTGEDLDLGALGGAAGLKDKLEGPLDLSIDLKGQGGSPRDIAASLNGAFSAVIVDSRVRRQAVEDAMGPGLAQLGDLLLGSSGDWVVVDCAVVDYGVQNGVMDAKAVFVDTAVSTVTADGQIDLRTEEISMGVQPQAGIFSVPLLVTGTLADPSVVPDPGKTLLSVGGALLTGGGLTAALAMMSAALPPDHPCIGSAEAAQEEAAAAESSPVEQIVEEPARALQGVEDAVQGLKDAESPQDIEDAVKGVTDGLKGLFGQ
ncbi:MAG: AsmA family protein [Alphaproteobacteria bacterium]|nr:AsmA family protein [Alphaproteobacteria bacterium]